MRVFFKFVFLLIFTLTINNANATGESFYNAELYHFVNESFQPVESPEALSATISGSATVCQNSSSPVVTFTGFGGTPPYTFAYTLNDVVNTPIKTTSGNSVTLAVPTNVADAFFYTLKSVSDISNVLENQTGTVVVRVNPVPEIDFTFVDNQCAGKTIQFTSSVTSLDSVEYSWNFGDTSTSTEQNPTHNFICKPGKGTQFFDVILVATNASTKCSSTITKRITLYQIPDATISGTGSGTFSNGVPVFQIRTNSTSVFTFTNSSNTLPSNLSYTISWGDGSSDFVSNSWTTLTHTYQIGLWNMVYTIQGPNGCSIVKPYIVFVGANPTVFLGKPANTNICHSTSLTFPISGTRNNPPGTIYTVTFTDGSLPQVFNHPPPSAVIHEFKNPSCGSVSTNFPNFFSATINAENPSGNYESVVEPIYVTSPPEAGFSLPKTIVCVNDELCITNTTANGLTASSTGCKDPNIVWSISPSTGVTLASGRLGHDAYTNDQSMWLSGSNVICPIFTIPGHYKITFKVGNFCGIDSISKEICVEAQLLPKFTIDANAGCTPLIVKTTNITDTAYRCTSPMYRWSVSYTSGNCGSTSGYTYLNKSDSSSAVSPSFQFTNPGIYTIQLSANNNCAQTYTQTVEVKKSPTVSINDIPNFCGTAVINPKVIVNSCSPTTNYSWSFPGGIPVSATTENPGLISYQNPGKYTVSLTLFNECGVSVTEEKTFLVDTVPVITNASLAQAVCSGQNTELVILNSDYLGTTYIWTAKATLGVTGFTKSGITNVIPVQTLATTSNAAGTVTYEIIPKLKGCDGAVTNYVVTVNPIAIFTGQPDSSTVCLGGTPKILSVSYTNVISNPTYQWYANTVNNNASGTAIVGETTSKYDPPATTIGTIYYYCIITLPTGACNNITSNTATVNVIADPTISKQPVVKQDICVGGTLSDPLFANYIGGTGTVSYQWFSNSINSNVGGTLISGANSSNYTPPVFNTVGTYYFYVILTFSGSGCGIITSAASEINVVADPVVSVQPLAYQEVCQSVAPIDLNVTVTGGLGVYLYQWYSNLSDNTTSGSLIPGATAATYRPSTSSDGINFYYCKITQTNGLGCDAISETAEVKVNEAPTINTQPLSSAVCLNGTPTVLFVTYLKGQGVPVYQWFSNTVDNTTTGIAILGANTDTYNPPTSVIDTTFYYCTIKLPIATCFLLVSNTATVAVNAVPAISTQPLFTQDICVGGTIATPLSLKYTGGAGITSYQWFSNISNSNAGGDIIIGATNPTYTPPAFSAVGTFYYYVVLTFTGSACGSLTSNVSTINVIADPVVILQPLVTQTLCQSSTASDLTVAANGGLGAYLYQWFSNSAKNATSGTLIVGATSSTYKPLTLTVGTSYYYCLVTQQNGVGCNATSEIAEVIVVPAPTLTAQPASSPICEGGIPTVLSVSFTGGVGTPSYQWFSNTANNTTSGTTISGATDSTYNPPKIAVGTIYYYCVISLPSGGCSNLTTSIAQVTINANPLISSKSLTICSSDTFLVVPNISNGDIVPTGITYTWSSPTISPAGSVTGAKAQLTPQKTISQSLINTANVQATVTYTVTPISGVCVGSDFNVVVTINPAININTTVVNITCLGFNNGIIQANINGGIPNSSGAPYTISWTGPNGFTSNVTSLSNLSSGIYKLSVSDASGCTVTRSYTIVEPEAILITTDSKKDVNCFGSSSGEIALTVSGGTVPYNFAWTKNSLPFATKEDLSNLGPGDYEVTVSDINNCAKKTASFTITEPLQFIVTGNISHVIDLTTPNSGAISLTVSGGIPPYTYSWSNGAKTKDLAYIPAGKYLVNVTDSKSCVQMVQFDVLKQLPINIIVSSKNDFNCLTQEPVKVNTAYITGGIPPYQLTWSKGTVSGTNNEIMTTSENGAVNLKVVDAYGLTANYIFNIEITLGIDYKLVNCREYLGQFNALDPAVSGQKYTYLWNFGDGQSSTIKNVQHSYSASGTYQINLTITSLSCVSNYQSVVSFEPLPKLLLENEIKMCVGDSVIQRVSNAVTHVWSNGSTDDNILIKEKGNYSVICTSKDGCLDTLNFKVTCDLYNFTIQTDRESLTLDNTPLQLWSENIPFSNYYWDFGDGYFGEGDSLKHTFNAIKEGYFDVKLKVINPNKCNEYATKRIWIVNNSEANAFTPNGDGKNDKFMPGWHLKVYNRNGILLYEGNDGWDGNYNGNEVSKGTYFYVMDYASETGPKFKEGYVMVIR